MIKTIAREWEIAKEYISNVSMREGLIHLDWRDFESIADKHRPVLAVKVDDDGTIGELTAMGLKEIGRHLPGKVSGLIVAVSFRSDDEITMDEVNCLNDCFDTLLADDMEFKWGVSPVDNLGTKRSVTLFLFE